MEHTHSSSDTGPDQRMTETIDADAEQRLYIKSLQDITMLARQDIHNTLEQQKRTNCQVFNKFDRELAERKFIISIQRLEAEKHKRQLLVTKLQFDARGEEIANLTTELQLMNDELQRMYSAHQATVQILAEKHVELTAAQQALDALTTQADGQQAQLASTLRDVQAEAKTLRARCKELTEQLEEAAQQQAASTSDVAALQANLDDVVAQLHAAKAAHKAQAQQHANAVQDYEERLHAARTEAARNQQRADLAASDVQELQKLLQQRSTMVEDVVASQTRAIMDANQQRVEMLTEELKRLQQQLQAEWQRNTRLEQQLSQARLREAPLARTTPMAVPMAAAPRMAANVAHALHAVESCIDATANSGGSPHVAALHRPLLPVEPTMSSPGLARVVNVQDMVNNNNNAASANASTPLPRDVAAAEALVHHVNQPRRGYQQAEGPHDADEPSDLRPIALPQHSVDEPAEPSQKTRGRGGGGTARGGKRKAVAVARDENEEEEEEPVSLKRGRGGAKGATKGGKIKKKAVSSVPRADARTKQGGQLPLVEEDVEEEGALEEAGPSGDVGGVEHGPGAIDAVVSVQPRTTMLPVVGRGKSNALQSITARVGNAAAKQMQGGVKKAAANRAMKTTLSGHSTTVIPASMILGEKFQMPKLAGR